ncbi:50S ribosomal protein L34e [Candidatus Woesearchaeota archaeon]|nr:50S ribosomal protein L34e [Candidatus Woesearchaeota archaeon]
MPQPSRRSRTLRRVFVKTPGGVTKLQYRKRKPSKAHCAGCGTQLAGVPHDRRHVMRNLAKTKKRPQRPFGGNLCSACSRATLLQRVLMQ